MTPLECQDVILGNPLEIQSFFQVILPGSPISSTGEYRFFLGKPKVSVEDKVDEKTNNFLIAFVVLVALLLLVVCVLILQVIFHTKLKVLLWTLC